MEHLNEIEQNLIKGITPDTIFFFYDYEKQTATFACIEHNLQILLHKVNNSIGFKNYYSLDDFLKSSKDGNIITISKIKDEMPVIECTNSTTENA